MTGGRISNRKTAKHVMYINHKKCCIQYFSLNQKGQLTFDEDRPVLSKTEPYDVVEPQLIQQPIVPLDVVPLVDNPIPEPQPQLAPDTMDESIGDQTDALDCFGNPFQLENPSWDEWMIPLITNYNPQVICQSGLKLVNLKRKLFKLFSALE
jgi:hypothetical protein